MKSPASFLSNLFFFFSLAASYQTIPAIHQKMDSLERELNFSGVVLIAKGDSILLHKGYGFMHDKKGVRMDKNTVFQIASITKAFTAVAIVKLAEQGKLNLQDSLSTYFSNMPGTGRCITIHQLLIHESGLPQAYAAEGKESPESAAKAVLKLNLEATPGSKFIYSNGNYTLLALIIEKVTGLNWEEYIRTTILKPLQMNQTYFWSDQNLTGFPEVLPKKNIKKRKRDYGYLGSTGIFSTAVDLDKFLRGINTNILIKEGSRMILFGKYVKLKSVFSNSTDYYSYGLFTTEGSVNSYWVRGNEESWGVSVGYHLPKSGMSIIVLSNKQKLSNGEMSHIRVSSLLIDHLK